MKKKRDFANRKPRVADTGTIASVTGQTDPPPLTARVVGYVQVDDELKIIEKREVVNEMVWRKDKEGP